METIDLLRSGKLQGIKRLDLLDRCQLPVEDLEKSIANRLVKLQQNCLQSSPVDRPLFMSIVKILVGAIHELPLSQEK